MLLDLRRAENTKGTILRAIILVGIAIARRLALVKSPVILLKELKLNSVALRLIIIEFRGGGYLRGCCFGVILIAGDCYSALGTIRISPEQH